MSRLATPVPRRRRLRTPAPRVPLSATHADFEPYGYHGVGETPGPVQTTAEKLAPGPAATKAAAHTPPPSKSGGTSGDLTIPGYQPETPTGTPYVPSEPGHSAQDFARAEAAKRREEALRSLAPLTPPGSGGLTPIDRLAQAAGAAVADPLQTLLKAWPKPDGPSLLGQIPELPDKGLPYVGLVPKTPIASAEVQYRSAIGANKGNAAHPSQTVSEIFDGAKPRGVAAALIAEARSRQAKPGPGEVGPARLEPVALKSIGIDTRGISGVPGSVQAIDRYLHMAGWKHGDEASQLKALTAYFGAGNPDSKQRARAILAGTSATRPSAPAGDPTDPLGAKTLGNVTLAQLQQAAKAGTLKIKGGTLSTPANRQILHQLLAAHKTLQDSRTLGHANVHGTLTPEEIGTLLVEESNKLHAHLNPAEVAEGIGVAEAESAGNADEQRQLAEFSNPEDAHIGLFAEEGNGFELNPTQRLNAREASRGAIERFVDDERSWNPAWVHWQEIQGETETGADRAPQYRALARELVQGGKQVDPAAVKQLVDAKHAAVKAGINPTPWNGDVEGGGSDYVWVRSDAKGAVNWARSTLGTQEGSPKQRHWAELEALGPSEPWCADWVAVNLARRGVELPEGPNGSWNYEDPSWKGGTQLGTDPSVAKPGDLIVYGGGAHIAMYVGDGKVIAGNWGDEVAEYGATEDSRGISAIVRPHYKGGKVKVKAGQLPGSSSESTFGGEGVGGESVGSSVGEAVPASSPQAPGQSRGQAASAALANFTVPTAPGYAATVVTPEINGEQTAAQELLALLTRRATGVNRA